ncbi:MAG: hypothetical protein KC426_08940, partial [Oceanospirillaceae bacterium]|nr:hypothetical protein [Oceanospirillaceae bacterium]
NEYGYQFHAYQGPGQWQPINSRGFQQQTTLSQIKLVMPSRNLDGRPSVVFLPSKEPQIYTIAVTLEGYTWLLQSLPPKPLTLIAAAYE